MRISRKIGLGFFITFFLVILLGALSIYSLRYIYRGLNQVFTKHLPASRFTYQIAISREKVFSEFNNFMITGNENFKIRFEDSYRKMEGDILNFKKFIVSEEEDVLFQQLVSLSKDMYELSEDIFRKRLKLKGLFKETIGPIEIRYREKLDELFSFEEDKMRGEKDLLLLHAQYIPASSLIMEARSRFLNLFNGLSRYVIRDDGDVLVSRIADDMSVLDKSIKDYKSYYSYSLSDKEREILSGLIDLSVEIRPAIDSVIEIKDGLATSMGSLLVKESAFMEVLDKIIALKKSALSSKLGIGAALTEDIPAIQNISKFERDVTESRRLVGRYLLTNDENYKQMYYQLRQNIDNELKDYGRHARLRGTEEFLEGIVESDNSIFEMINSNIDAFDRKEKGLSSLISIEMELENKIDEFLKYNDSIIKEAQDVNRILKENIPAKWVLVRLKGAISTASRLIVDYLNEQDSQYKDRYSELYFDMKKNVSSYRDLFTQQRDRVFIEEIEQGLDKFNEDILEVIDNHDKIVKERGWGLVKLEEGFKERLDKAVELEISQMDKKRIELKKRIAVINTLIFVIIGGVALITVFVIFYTTSSITNPIQQLYRGAEIIGGGDLDHRLNIKTGDEIQDLAEGFNRMAGELKELYTNLENKVKERTAQLAEVNNALALKNKELDDFTYIVSHDLKEPLRGVKAFTKVIMDEYAGRLDNEGKDYLKTISDSSTRMTHLIEDLLNLSRIGRIKNIEPDVDLNDVLLDVKKNLEYSLEEKKVDLKIAQPFPKVTCDRIRIAEVFTNLISNATKYSKKDVRPIIELGYSDKGTFYEFYVKDNGIGIEKEYHDKIFQIFQRLHAKGEYEGTGAGLTIVKKIIESHGGRIWVDSETGEGSTFYFTLYKKGDRKE